MLLTGIKYLQSSMNVPQCSAQSLIPAWSCLLSSANHIPDDAVQLKAVRLIKAADVIMYDDLGAEVSPHNPDDASTP